MAKLYKTCIIKKLYNGHASIRDYLIEGAILKGQGIKIHFQHHIMTIPLEHLAYTFQFHKYRFQSKFGEKNYQLVDFCFVPDELTKVL